MVKCFSLTALEGRGNAASERDPGLCRGLLPDLHNAHVLVQGTHYKREYVTT